MSLYFDPILNMPRQGGLTLRVTNNGDGTLTLSWSGFNLEAIDPAGGWFVEESLDGSSWSAAFDTSPGQLGDDWGAGTLGVVNYYRVKAKDSGAVLLKTSNVVSVTLPEPWELSNVVAYLDADASRIETIPGLRLTAASTSSGVASPHYSSPHLSTFDGASAMTLFFWKKEYGPGNVDQKGMIQQGWSDANGNTIANGWNFCGGAYGGVYCGDAAQFRVVTGGVYKDWIFSSGAGETAVGAASCYAVTFNAGTVRIWVDGVERTLTAPGSPPSVLPTSSELLRIGRGYYPANCTFCHASGYNAVLSDAEIEARTLNREVPLTYAELTTDQKTNLVFHYEHGNLDCDHTAATLTAVSGGGTLEYTVVERYEPISETWLTTKFGTGPKLDESGIFAAGQDCLFNDAEIRASDLSRCRLTGAIASNPMTSGTNSWMYQYKPTAIAAVENFSTSLDGGPLTPQYLMPGYQFNTPDTLAGLRVKSVAATARDGWLRSNLTIAANTAYLTFWHAASGTFTHFQNGSEGTVTPAWSIGTTPNSMADVSGLDNLGTFQNGGSWKGYEGPTIICDPKLTSAQQAQLTAYYT
jgi:hypothetical protein